MLFLALCSLVVAAVTAQNGTCTCGIFVVIQNQGVIPPETNLVGPVYELPVESEQSAPCNGNVQAACDLYCDSQMERLVAEGFSFDTEVEIEVGPGIYNNITVGEISCTRSYQLHPFPDRYAGTADGGEPCQLAISVSAGSCSDWVIRRIYPDVLLCCNRQHEYFSCAVGPVA